MFDLINCKEIKDKAYDYLLSLCDKASYLLYENNIRNLNLKPFKDKHQRFFSDYKHTEQGPDNWNMHGTIYFYGLNGNIKQTIKDNSLAGIIKLSDGLSFENLTLYKNNKVLYSICSHEGYEEIDKEFEQQVTEFCLKAIKSTPLYQELLTKHLSLTDRNINTVFEDLLVLEDLKAYIEEAWQFVIRMTPRKPVTYQEYFSLAQKYLSSNLVKTLENANDFKSLHPSGYPKTIDEASRFNLLRFENTQTYKQLCEEIKVYYALMFNLYKAKPKQDSFPQFLL